MRGPRASWLLAACAFAVALVALLVLLLVLFGEETPAGHSTRGFFYDFPRVTIGGTRYHAEGVAGWLYLICAATPAGLLARVTRRRLRTR